LFSTETGIHGCPERCAPAVADEVSASAHAASNTNPILANITLLCIGSSGARRRPEVTARVVLPGFCDRAGRGVR
jgi:hypothetical protein